MHANSIEKVKAEQADLSDRVDTGLSKLSDLVTLKHEGFRHHLRDVQNITNDQTMVVATLAHQVEELASRYEKAQAQLQETVVSHEEAIRLQRAEWQAELTKHSDALEKQVVDTHDGSSTLRHQFKTQIEDATHEFHLDLSKLREDLCARIDQVNSGMAKGNEKSVSKHRHGITVPSPHNEEKGPVALPEKLPSSGGTSDKLALSYNSPPSNNGGSASLTGFFINASPINADENVAVNTADTETTAQNSTSNGVQSPNTLSEGPGSKIPRPQGTPSGPAGPAKTSRAKLKKTRKDITKNPQQDGDRTHCQGDNHVQNNEDPVAACVGNQQAEPEPSPHDIIAPCAYIVPHTYDIKFSTDQKQLSMPARDLAYYASCQRKPARLHVPHVVTSRFLATTGRNMSFDSIQSLFESSNLVDASTINGTCFLSGVASGAGGHLLRLSLPGSS